MFTIAGGVMLGILGARLLMRAPGLLFVFGPPVLAAFFLTRGYETLGAFLLLAVALFWSSFAITFVHEMWGAPRAARPCKMTVKALHSVADRMNA